MPRPRLETPVYRLFQRPGRNAWYIRWTGPDGRSQTASTGADERADAERFAREFGRENREPAGTLAGLIDTRVASRAHKASHGHLAADARRLKARLAALGATRPEHVTPQLVADYIKARGERITACRHELSLLRGATGIKVQMPGKRPAAVRAFDREDGQRLIAASKGYLRLLIIIALTTGRRVGAILDLTWDRVDMRRGVIDFRNPAKGESNKRRGFSPMAPQVKAALAAQREWAKSAHVIETPAGEPVTDFRKAWWWAMKRAGLGEGEGKDFKPAFSPHAMKHSAISWLAENDRSVDQISDLTDTDPKTVRRIYRRVNPGALRELAGDLGDALKISPVARETRRKG
jgi:integrase